MILNAQKLLTIAFLIGVISVPSLTNASTLEAPIFFILDKDHVVDTKAELPEQVILDGLEIYYSYTDAPELNIEIQYTIGEEEIDRKMLLPVSFYSEEDEVIYANIELKEMQLEKIICGAVDNRKLVLNFQIDRETLKASGFQLRAHREFTSDECHVEKSYQTQSYKIEHY